MKLKTSRFHFDPDYTIGKMFVDGEYECFTLEDTVREIETRPVAEWKLQDRTAIPRGIYVVDVTFSNRFRKPTPLLLDVPGFSGVRIHSGNTSANTEGCILVGKDWNGGDWIDKSRIAFAPLFAKILAAHERHEQITLEIV